jgi:hypothetical protein
MGFSSWFFMGVFSSLTAVVFVRRFCGDVCKLLLLPDQAGDFAFKPVSMVYANGSGRKPQVGVLRQLASIRWAHSTLPGQVDTEH